MGTVRPPIAISGGASGAEARLTERSVGVDDALLERLRSACPRIRTDAETLAEAARDWWPLGMVWATQGAVPSLPAVIAEPASTEEVAGVLAVCNEAHVPVTASGGRSGVCGGSVPLHGGVSLDLTGLSGIRTIDEESLTVDVWAGTFGDDFEATLADQGLTAGHWPQSIALSTVGGWLACRSAGQMSNRYGKIEDMVVGLDVVLADGSVIATGGFPRAAVGPDLNQLFVGSEGTLGIITGARLRVHRQPASAYASAWAFASFEAGLDACRRLVQRGCRAAVVRLYDTVEAERNFGLGDTNLLLIRDEADPAETDATESMVEAECADATPLDAGLVDTWMEHRNDVSALETLISQGYVVDTMEVSAPWASLAGVYAATVAAIGAVEPTLSVSAHQSHAYTDGACIYFTFGGQPDPDQREAYYRDVWTVGTQAALAAGASLSHHHGVGLNRGPFVAEALGTSFGVLKSVKEALDPNGILNPGKLGLNDLLGGEP